MRGGGGTPKHTPTAFGGGDAMSGRRITQSSALVCSVCKDIHRFEVLGSYSVAINSINRKKFLFFKVS